jgi:hypothetical protein
MSLTRFVFGLCMLIVAGIGWSAPAAAEFFGCNDTRGQVLYDSSRVTHHAYRHTSHTLAAQRRHRPHRHAMTVGQALPSAEHWR